MKRDVITVFLLVPGILLFGCRGKEETRRLPQVTEHLSPDAGSTIVVEAEEFSGELEPPVTLGEDAGASGGRCVRIEGGSGKPGETHPVDGTKYPARYGAAVYSFTVKEAGKYRFWGRRFWEDGCGNSFTLIANGGRPALFGGEGTYDHWEWTLCTALFDLPVGENTIEVLNREDGVRLDKFILTTNPDFVPQGKE